MFVIIETTLSHKKGAKFLAKKLLKKHLVACVQRSRIQSRYMWESQMQKEQEYLLRLKTRKKHLKKIYRLFKSHHPYEVPEFIVIPIQKISKPYAKWINSVAK